MKLQRPLICGFLAFGLLAAGIWWTVQQSAPAGPTSSVPAVVMPAASSPATAAGTTDVDGLWKRYETLSNASTSPTTDAGSAPAPNEAQEQAVPESMRERQQARERTRERREALRAARNDALKQIHSLKSGDPQALVEVLEDFNRRLKENGVPEQINISAIRQQMLASQKLAQVNQALLDEALKGAKANPQRLRALSRELSQLQKDITESFALGFRDGPTSP